MTALWHNIFTKRSELWLGLLAFFLVVVNLDVAEECPWTLNGPGLTFDENLNVAGGVYVVESVLNSGLAALHPRTLSEIFNSPNYHPDYPPLGRLPLGMSNAILSRTSGLGTHEFYLITYARVGSAIAFGLLISLVVAFTRKHAGNMAGAIAGASLLFTPRVFGHAHLANVETMMNLMYALSVLACVHLLAGRETLRARDGLLPGLILGLALLTKIQAIFLPPVIAVWILWHWRVKGLLALAVITVTSGIVFFVGWPWLWSDPVTRFISYFTQSANRAVLYCFYLGARYADKEVPWHYPFVMFLTTTPFPWLLLGGWGMWLTRNLSEHRRRPRTRREDPHTQLTPQQNHLLLGAFWLPLIVFAIPGVPVYDGERLFLMVWPIFSIWVGIAACKAYKLTDDKAVPAVRYGIIAVLLLVPLGSMFSLHPVQLCFYDFQVGGLKGASSLKMERDYWGSSMNAEFLRQACDKIPEGSTLAIAPVLHPLYPQFLKQDSWLIHRPDIKVVAYDDKIPDGPRHVLLIRRMADQWHSLAIRPAGARILQRFTRQGVELAELLELPSSQADTTMSEFEQARESHRKATHNVRSALIHNHSTRR